MTQQYDFTTNTWQPIKLCNCRCPIMPVNDSNEEDHEQFKITCMVLYKTRPRTVKSIFYDTFTERPVLEVVE